MRKLPIVFLLAVFAALVYVGVTDPKALVPRNPRLTPSATVAEVLPTETAVPAPTSTSIPTSPPTPTLPSPTIYPTSTPVPAFAGLTVTQEEYAILGRLCVIETRGYSDLQKRQDACLSVIGTVMARTLNEVISDGSIIGTIGWNCTAESETCQFPAYVLFEGCDGLLPVACAANYPDDLRYFTQLAKDYFLLGTRGSCDGYIFYGIQTFDVSECSVRDEAGNWMNWHRKVVP